MFLGYNEIQENFAIFKKGDEGAGFRNGKVSRPVRRIFGQSPFASRASFERRKDHIRATNKLCRPDATQEIHGKSRGTAGLF